MRQGRGPAAVAAGYRRPTRRCPKCGDAGRALVVGSSGYKQVMLGRRSPQNGLFSAASRIPVDLEEFGVYGRLALEGRSLFRDSDFAAAYSTKGRPSTPPSLLALACLLQHHEGISDAEVVERTKYDLRWKVVLDLDPVQVVAPFAKSTYQSFRARLALHEKEALAFEKSVEVAAQKGLFRKSVGVALDSSPVRGRGAIKDTFNLLSDAIRCLVRGVAKKRGLDPSAEALRVGVERHFNEASIKGQVTLDWDNVEQKNAFLASLLEDCNRALEAARRAKYTGDEVGLLKKVIAQDVDESGDTPTIRDGVAKDRTVSVQDPDMRHGRKSSGKTYNGHKAHVAVETQTGIITAVDVTIPATPDGSKVAELVAETERLTGSKVQTILGDSAYSSRTAVEQAEQVEADLVAKVPEPPKGRFGPRAFKVSKDRQTAVCPAGFFSEKRGRSKDSVVHTWATPCAACPLRGRCYSREESEQRRLVVAPDFHARLQRARRAKSAKGRALLKYRVVAEHAIARTKNLGAATARYFGRARTRGQWLWSAAMANLQRIWFLCDRDQANATVTVA